MGYVNPDHKIIRIHRIDKRIVSRKRRRVLKRELYGEHLRRSYRAVRNGWWYA